MKITDCKVTKYEKDNVKGFASITLDGCMLLSGMKIMNGKNGLFVTMPQQKYKDTWKDIFFPITKEFRQQLQDAILKEYNGQALPETMDEDDELPF